MAHWHGFGSQLPGSMLVPQKGYKDLFGSDDIPYSVFANLILAY